MSLTRALAIGGFVVAIALFAAVEWAARREGSRIPRMVMRYEVGRLPVGRIGVFGLWWWMGWHFLAR